MKITNYRRLQMSFTPHAVTNKHLVKIRDRDVGTVIKEIDVPTGKSFLYYIICMEVQTSGSLRIGEQIKLGDAIFDVFGINEGWYQISTSEIKAGKFEMWNANMLIEKINCRI